MAVQSYVNYCHDNYFFSNKIMLTTISLADRRALPFAIQNEFNVHSSAAITDKTPVQQGSHFPT